MTKEELEQQRLSRQIWMHKKYQRFCGGDAVYVPPSEVYLTTEGGDTLTTESGDGLIIE